MSEIKLYDIKELAEILHVSTRTLMRYIKDERLRAVKIGGKWTVSEENLQNFINGK